MSTVYKWQIYCNTESQFVGGYGITEPTVCYNNNTHDINPNSIQQLGQYSPQSVIIQEEDPLSQTGGHYGCWAFSFNAVANTTTNFTSNFPYAIAMLACQLQVSPDMIGDTMNFGLAPNTTIGIIVADIALGSTTVTVSPTVISNAFIGLEVTITDGTNTNSCGRIIGIDSVGSTVTFETATNNSFAAATPTYFQVTRYFVKNYDLNVSGIHQIGFSKIGAGYIPSTINGLCAYTNTSSSDKKICFSVEHLY